MATRSRLLMLLAGPLAAAGGCTHFLRAPTPPADKGVTAEVRSADTHFAELQNSSGFGTDSIWVGRGAARRESLVRATWAEEDVSPLDGDGILPIFPSEEPIKPAGGTEPPDKPASRSEGSAPKWNSAEKLPPPSFGPSKSQSLKTPESKPDDERPAEPKPAAKTPEIQQAPGTRRAPTATGAQLALGPQENAVERALLLNKMLEQSQSEARTLRDRVQSLEGQVHTLSNDRDQFQRDAERAAADAARYRAKMEALNEEVVSLRERVRRGEQQELQSLQELVAVLERLALDPPPRKKEH